jgi:hypothetical protein
MSSPKAYPGSCHCGAVQYLVKLAFPPIPDPAAESIRIYKCNCNTCQKMGYFHCRPTKPGENYILLSPSDPSELFEYRCNAKHCGWYSCKTCGVRVLGLIGEWEQIELDVEKWAGRESEGKTRKVWKTNGEEKTMEVGGKTITKPFYLSVNAVTLEPGEEIDLRKWHENGWVFYVESRRKDGTPMRMGEPHEGGMY